MMLTPPSMWYLILAIVIGPGFCFTIEDKEQPKSRQRFLRELGRRMWLDDISPVILKHCFKYNPKRSEYLKCLESRCPSCTLKISGRLRQFRRNLDEENADSALINDGANIDLASAICSRYRKDKIVPTNPQFLEEGSRSPKFSDLVIENVEFALCSARKCFLSRETFLPCVAEKCCEEKLNLDAESPEEDLDYQQQEDSQPLAMKRRINDDMSQCIQSYCNGKHYRDRVVCIVKFCNRIKRF